MAKTIPGEPRGALRRGATTDAKAIMRAAKIAEILELRVAGYSLKQIGESMSPPVTPQRIHNIIVEELAKSMREPLEAVRDLELQRLDAMFVKQFARAVDGDAAAVASALSIADRRARLIGLDSPTKSEVSGPNGAPVIAPFMISKDIAGL